ncbi:hypothetical protein AAHB33_03390 [Paenarthrobacter sp. S56]|uniref:hypothetical protein n=1 Tax=Paenarthrobacter sp. S56 TaxID=3138179 RepID=UPI00321BDB03
MGIVGGLTPVKAAVLAPLLAQPVSTTIAVAAAVGLVLGAAGFISPFDAGAPAGQRMVESAPVPKEVVVSPSQPPTPTATETTSAPAEAPVPIPVVTPREAAPEPQPAATTPVTLAPVPPPPTATPEPLPEPTRDQPKLGAEPAIVTASVTESKAGSPGSTPLRIAFEISGSGPLGEAEVVFSVPDGKRIIAGSVEAPDGWSCAAESASKTVCTTKLLEREGLHFHLTVESRRHSKDVLTYGLDGDGIAAQNFVHRF